MNTGLSSQHFIRRGFVEPQLSLNDISYDLWKDMKRILHAIQQTQSAHPDQAAGLINAMIALHADLQDKPAFDCAAHFDCTVNRGEGPWVKRLLLQDSEMYLQLITYFPEYSTPIHDYPGQTVVNLPLSGRMCIDYYHLGHAAMESAYPIAKLRHTESHNYGVYEASMAFPWQENIQEIRAVTERCVVLSVGLIPTEATDKSWYLPISPQNANTFFAQRLKRNE